MRRFVSVDVETTGLDPCDDEIIEVGLVIEREPRVATHNQPVIEEVTFSLEFDEDTANPKALEINGWGKRSFPEVWAGARAAGFLAEVLRGCHIVGKNPGFDAAFIEHFLNNYYLAKTWHHRMVDVGTLAWGYWNGLETATEAIPQGYRYEPPSVEDTEGLIGIDRVTDEGYHTALYDAKWNYEAFRRVVPFR